MNNCLKLNVYVSIFVATIVFSLIGWTLGNPNLTESRADIYLDSNGTVVSDKSSTGRAIKDDSNNMLEKAIRSDTKARDSIRKEKDMYDVMSLHQISANHDKELKADSEKKEKGKLQTVGGVVGEIIAVIVSEVVKLFGNMVSDVAREVTAHGFVSVFKQFTDLTGISMPEI